MKPQVGKGRIQWNGSAWFGGQLGGTAWMALGGAVLFSRSPLVGGAWLFASMLVNLLGLFLYSRRHTLAPYFALQMLLAACAVAAVFAWTLLVVTRGDLVPLLRATALQGYLALLLFPALMLWFHFQEGIPLKIHRVTQNREIDRGP